MKNQIQSEWETLTLIEKMFFDLNGKNLMKSTNSIINNFDNIHPISCNIIISQILYTLCATNIYDFDMCLNFLKEIEALEASKKVNPSFFEIFTDILIKKNTQESFYLLENLVEHNFIQPNFIQTVKNPYFAHYMSKREIKKLEYFDFKDQILDNYEELSKNDWELHKQLIKEGHNPNEISKIIRNDEIEKLQEISSQNDFNFNQIIPKSLYERCSIINENYKIVRLIDYAAFFGSIKCFKYLLVNGADLKDTGKFSVAGGNEEIIHLCKQNHISFQGSIKIAIKFHKNDIFKYLYENNNKRFKNLTDLGKECILYHNYEIFTFLLENGMKINDDIINEATRNGNLYLVKYFHKEYPRLPNNILLISSETRNIELVKYILEQNEIDVSTKNKDGCTSFLLACKYGFNEMVEILIKINGIDIHVKDNSGDTALILASKYGNTEIVKLLLEQEGIDISEKNNFNWSALMNASKNDHTEIVKLLLKQEKIDVNEKNNSGDTVLIIASSNGHTEIVKLLLEQEGIDINAKNEYGDTALMKASSKGYTEIVKLLLEQEGIDINAKEI